MFYECRNLLFANNSFHNFMKFYQFRKSYVAVDLRVA